MSRTMTFFALALLFAVTASAARFSDTSKDILAVTRNLGSVQYGSKAQIADAKAARKAAQDAAKAVRKELATAKRVLLQAQSKANRLAAQALKPKAKKGVKTKAKAVAALVPGYENAVFRLQSAELKANKVLEEAKAHQTKMMTRRRKKMVTISGKRVPSICYCAKYPAGEGTCFGFTNGNYCEARPCEATHVCTTKNKSGGKVCFLRHVTSRVVSSGRGRCARQKADSSMYVPYWTHEEK